MTPLISLLSLLSRTSLLRSGAREDAEINKETSLAGTYREHLAETVILIVALIIIALVMTGNLK